jgi:hypothetical protein
MVKNMHKKTHIAILALFFVFALTVIPILSKAQSNNYKDDSLKNKVLSNNWITQEYNLGDDNWQLDLLFYPQFRFKNARLDRIYLLQLNINPALKFNLWRGAVATAQLILPVHNDFSTDENRVRPGFLTFSQHLSLPGGVSALISLGNFNMQRAGADIKVYKKIFRNAGIYAQAGYTYWSLPFLDSWTISKSGKTNWRVGANYFFDKANILINGNISKYLQDDIAARGEIIRFFKNSSVGFYIQTLQYEGYSLNGGFFFTINLPPRNRNWKKRLNIYPAKRFSMEYVARPYPLRGIFYQTSPDENSSFNFFNKNLINNNLFL